MRSFEIPSQCAAVPYRPPRRRPVGRTGTRRVALLVEQALGHAPAPGMRVSEWVGFDPREPPHRVRVEFAAGDRVGPLTFSKSTERLTLEDVRTALAVSGADAVGAPAA